VVVVVMVVNRQVASIRDARRGSHQPWLWIAVSLTPDTWFERVSMLVILLNCVTLGMFRPCEDIACDSQRCRILQVSVCVCVCVCVC
jgi:hypothetical protein